MMKRIRHPNSPIPPTRSREHTRPIKKQSRKDAKQCQKELTSRQQTQELLKLNGLPIKRQKEKPTDVFNKKGWKKSIIRLMSEGASLLEVLAELGISRTQHGQLMKLSQRPEEDFYTDAKTYAERINRGLELSEAWWLRAGREGLSLGKAFGSSLYYMNMKNRFGWAEKLKSDYGEETLKTLQDTITEIARGQKKKK